MRHGAWVACHVRGTNDLSSRAGKGMRHGAWGMCRMPRSRHERSVIPSVERGTWVGGVPTYCGWNPTRPGPSLDVRDDRCGFPMRSRPETWIVCHAHSTTLL